MWQFLLGLFIGANVSLFLYAIILAGNAQEKPQFAEVVEVGPGLEVDGKLEKMLVKKGDKVVVNKYAGTEVKYEGEDYIIVKQSDILAVVE